MSPEDEVWVSVNIDRLRGAPWRGTVVAVGSPSSIPKGAFVYAVLADDMTSVWHGPVPAVGTRVIASSDAAIAPDAVRTAALRLLERANG